MSTTPNVPAGSDELAAVADLAAGFGIERRAIEHDDAGLAGVQLVDRRALAVERRDAGAQLRAARSREIRSLSPAYSRPLGHREPARRARTLALRAHRRLEARHVEHHAALAADVGGEIDRKAEGVVELEHRLAVEQLVARGERTLEHAHAVLQRLGEALFLLRRICATRAFAAESSG